MVVGGVEIKMAPNDFDVRLQENIQSLLSKSELSDGTPAFGIATPKSSVKDFTPCRGSNVSFILRSSPPILRQRELKMGQERKGDTG